MIRIQHRRCRSKMDTVANQEGWISAGRTTVSTVHQHYVVLEIA
jgi:hypothetical protein